MFVPRLRGHVRFRLAAPVAAALAVGTVFSVAACGLQVQQPDLFLLTRTGNASTLTLLVNSGGTMRCNRFHSTAVPDKLLLEARSLTGTLDRDARGHLRIEPGPGSVYQYRVRLQQGTITFPDTAARDHHELAQLELLAVQLEQVACHSG